MKFATIALLAILALPVLASAETLNNVSLMDTGCAQKQAAKPDEHTRACALQCQKSGFGIFTADGKYLKFDGEGNSQVVAQLNKSQKNDHLRVNVTGEVAGDTIKVKTVTLL